MSEMTPEELAVIKEGYRAHRFCGVCVGLSPSWDGHDIRPACWGHVIESIPALIAEVERLSAASMRSKNSRPNLLRVYLHMS